MRRLLAADGEPDSLGYFATRRDKSVVFAASGRAALTYRVIGGVTLASADPIGDEEALAARPCWRGCRRRAPTAGCPGCSALPNVARRSTPTPGSRRWRSVTRRSWTCASSTSPVRNARGCARPCRRVERAGYTTRVRRHSEIAPDEMASILDLARGVARRGDRTRVLDGAGAPGRSERRPVRDGRGLRRVRCVARAAVVRAVGPPRRVAGPDAPRPGSRERPERVHGRPARRGRRTPWRATDLVELRDVPRGVRGGREDRRRPGAAGVAPGAVARVAVLPAGVAVPVERQVPARTGSRVSSATSVLGRCRGSASPPVSPRGSCRRCGRCASGRCRRPT